MRMKTEFFDIIELFRKSYGENISPEEQQKLEKLLENGQLRMLWDELERGDLVREGMRDEELFSSQRGFTEFKRRRKVNKHRRLRLYIALGISAAVVVFVINMIFMWLPSWEKKVEHQMLAVTPDIFPERNEARLLLGTGDTVVMTGKKQVFEDKNGTQIKYNNGSLEYSSEKETEEVVYNTLLVPVGGECVVSLADSSKVWLNADSKLKYPTRFAGNERGIELEGEAYFVVKHGDKPFIVHTQAGDVKVLGTSFGIRVYEQEEMLTTLVTGKVLYRGQDSVILEPGEQAVVALDGEVQKRKVEIEEYVGWKDGIYVFEHRLLGDIMNDFERWYGVKVMFVQPELKKLPFTGYIKRYDKINTFLKLLESTGELSYKIENKNIVLYKK